MAGAVLSMTAFESALVTAAAVGVACAVLSVFVVLRRWAFIGEGIAHAGFGGAGTAWMLSLVLPSSVWVSSQGGIYAIAVAFCMCMAVGIGYVTRREELRTDAAIGIFLVAALAWGFIAYGIYTHVHMGQSPPGWNDYVLGYMGRISGVHAAGAAVLCVLVILLTVLLWKEIVFYCFDPVLAGLSGVRVGFVHYLLLVMVALTIVTGMQLMGSLLVTALLVLPGATALLLSPRIGVVLVVSAAIGLVAGVGGTAVSAQWRFIPLGPGIVMLLVGQFGAAYLWRRFAGEMSAGAVNG